MCRGEVSADLLSLGRVEIRVKSEGFLPVPDRLAGIVRGVVTAGETVVGTSLLVFIADLAGQDERGGVLCAGVAGLVSREKKLT